MADYWETYTKAEETEDILTKLKLLTECIGQEEDEVTRRIAFHDLGDIFYMGKGVPVDKERGKKLMKASADLGHGPAMNLYGQMLTHDGDLECITYFCMALDEAQLLAAKNLNDLLAACRKAGNTQVCNAIEAGVGEVARINREDKKEDENGSASLVLALIGLYGLGEKCGITPEQGEEYLQKSIQKGNSMARVIDESPELKHPATVASFKPSYMRQEEEKNTNNDKHITATKSAQTAQPAQTTQTTQTTENEPTPFGLFDAVFSLVVGAVGGLLINWIFQTGFWIPFIIVTLIWGGLTYMGSKH